MVSKLPARPESIALIGGHVALDLVNTVSWRQDADQWRENLARPCDLLTWAHRAGVLNGRDLTHLRSAMSEDTDMARRVLRSVQTLREQLYQYLAECIDHRGVQPHIAPGTQLHQVFLDAISASKLSGSPARWTLDTPAQIDVPRVLALHALDLTQTMSRERLRRCEDDGCGWLFLDSTRNHSRRWCSSGDCGNRARARRHYARSRQTDR
ncbi:MAG: CGNR zinc finger domain-containing protein [Solirubrobacterales bacterium]|nr:CGNR zinc finger domain-containing protein [Solirubrobacterales bacterium]